jgi:hypothetical protein
MMVMNNCRPFQKSVSFRFLLPFFSTPIAGLNNCVNRFIDASQFMLQRLSQMQQPGGGKMG